MENCSVNERTGHQDENVLEVKIVIYGMTVSRKNTVCDEKAPQGTRHSERLANKARQSVYVRNVRSYKYQDTCRCKFRSKRNSNLRKSSVCVSDKKASNRKNRSVRLAKKTRQSVVRKYKCKFRPKKNCSVNKRTEIQDENISDVDKVNLDQVPHLKSISEENSVCDKQPANRLRRSERLAKKARQSVDIQDVRTLEDQQGCKFRPMENYKKALKKGKRRPMRLPKKARQSACVQEAHKYKYKHKGTKIRPIKNCSCNERTEFQAVNVSEVQKVYNEQVPKLKTICKKNRVCDTKEKRRSKRLPKKARQSACVQEVRKYKSKNKCKFRPKKNSSVNERTEFQAVNVSEVQKVYNEQVPKEKSILKKNRVCEKKGPNGKSRSEKLPKKARQSVCVQEVRKYKFKNKCKFRPKKVVKHVRFADDA